MISHKSINPRPYNAPDQQTNIDIRTHQGLALVVDKGQGDGARRPRGTYFMYSTKEASDSRRILTYPVDTSQPTNVTSRPSKHTRSGNLERGV